jgi:CheY-like chemotaxis protein
VLLVDDDGANLRVFLRVFHHLFDVVTAESGEDALALLGREPFDLALVDYWMPGMNGLSLLRRMQEAHPAVKRLMLTAHADLPELDAAVASGLALRVVTKPWDRAEIERLVAELVAPAPNAPDEAKPAAVRGR